MFASLGAYGHLYPMMPLALAFADAGHEAVIASGPPFLGRLPRRPFPGTPPVSSSIGRSRKPGGGIPICTIKTAAWPCLLT
jgi:hypothetical protein